MQRRQALQLIGTGLVSGILTKAVAPANAGDVKEIRIGYQKSGLLPVLKQRQTLDAVFKPQAIAIQWVEFSFGPPILEGINTGNLDFGYTGDAPPIFAQAASANLVYAATLSGNSANGILVKEASPIKKLADLKGKKVGFGKASSAHTTVLYALDKAGLSYSDIEPVYLAPPDGTAAFARGAIMLGRFGIHITRFLKPVAREPSQTETMSIFLSLSFSPTKHSRPITVTF
jgi:sulfonate transport system substrate-binding protein